jgi:hypothetical protein
LDPNHHRCTNLEDDTFMDTTPEASALVLPCKLDDFKALQRKSGEELTNKLVVEWRQAVGEQSTGILYALSYTPLMHSSHALDYLQDIWDFYQAEWKKYDGGPLCRLLKVTELRMRGQMRKICENSVHNWLDFIQLYCGGAEPATDDKRKPQRGSITAEEMEEETFLQRKKREREGLPGMPPLFQAELKICGGVVELEPSGQAMKCVFQDAITQMVDSIKTFNTVDHEIMSLLHLQPKVIYNITGLNDECWQVSRIQVLAGVSRIQVLAGVSRIQVQSL